MQFNIDLSKMIHVLSCLSNVASLKTEEVDGYVLIDVEEDSVYFLSNSGTRAIDVGVTDFEFFKEGRCAVPYNKLSAFINAFKFIEENIKGVHFNLDQQGLVISILDLNNKVFSSTILNVASHHIITIPSPMEDTSFIINSDIIKVLLSKTQFSIDSKHVMEYLQSVYMKFHNGRVFLVGTDGVLLSEVATTSPSEASLVDYLVPISYFSKIPNFVKEDTPLLFLVEDSMIKMKCGDVCYHGSLVINSGFPKNYNDFLSKFKYEIELSVRSFLVGVSSTLSVLDNDADMKLALTLNENGVNIKSANAEYNFPIDESASSFFDEVIVNVDGGILLKALKTYSKSEKINLKFTDSNSPIILYSNSIVEHTIAIAHIKG